MVLIAASKILEKKTQHQLLLTNRLKHNKVGNGEHYIKILLFFPQISYKQF